MSGRGGQALALFLVGAVGWYTGVKFWQPLIIEQLEKDNNLRPDTNPADFKDDSPTSWSDLKDRVTRVLHPEQYSTPSSAEGQSVQSSQSSSKEKNI